MNILFIMQPSRKSHIHSAHCTPSHYLSLRWTQDRYWQHL